MSGEVSLALEFASEASGLERARDDVRGRLSRLGVDETAIYGVDLALEELGGNAIRYGFDAGAAGSIRIAVRVAADTVDLSIEDDGRPFDPTRHPEPAVARRIEDVPVGGRGISLVRRFASSMRYARAAGRNRIEIGFARVTEPPSASTATGGSSPGSGSTR